MTLSRRFQEFIPFWASLWRLAAWFSRPLGLLSPQASLNLAMQIHRTARDETARASVEDHVISSFRNKVLITAGNGAADASPLPPNRILILKPYIGDNEKGVVKIMFSESFAAIRATPGFISLLRQYRVVLEPSWTGAADSSIVDFAAYSGDFIVLAAADLDYRFLAKFGKPFYPIRLGPCDWVDPDVARPFLGAAKQYDLVLNSLWAPWKRHEVLFDAMVRAPRRLTAALIGVPWQGATKRRIEGLVKSFGLEDQVTIFERIPYAEVMRVTAASRVALLLSLKEGSNRSLAEAMFCNVPVLLLDTHSGGIRKNVVPATGKIVREESLVRAIIDTIDAPNEFSPRSWAIENISCFRSTQVLNQHIKEVASSQGEDWTRDLVVHSNSPECRYVNPLDELELRPLHATLAGIVGMSDL